MDARFRLGEFMIRSVLGAAAAAIALLAPAGASADELRVGVVKHDIEGIGAGVTGKESGAALHVQYVADAFDGPNWFLSPRPYLGGNIHLDGKTSFGSGGLAWRARFAERWRFDIALGLAIHDGETEIPDAEPGLPLEENERRIRENSENIEFGSRVLFRQELSLGYEASEAWAAEIFFEHLSHGNILSDGANEGLNNIGLRVARRF